MTDKPEVLIGHADTVDAMIDEGEIGAVMIHVGAPGSMRPQDARIAAKVFKTVIRRLPPTTFIMLAIDGFDADPREVHDIPEAARQFREFAKAAFHGNGFDPNVLRLEEQSIAVLVECGAFGQRHPFTVRHESKH